MGRSKKKGRVKKKIERKRMCGPRTNKTAKSKDKLLRNKQSASKGSERQKNNIKKSNRAIGTWKMRR